MMPERFWACMRAGEACNDHGNESKVFNGMIPTEHTATCCPVAQWLFLLQHSGRYGVAAPYWYLAGHA
jgi:hypothetical protein